LVESVGGRRQRGQRVILHEWRKRLQELRREAATLRVRRRRHQLDVRGLEERHPVRLKPARHPHEVGDQDPFANPQQVLTGADGLDVRLDRFLIRRGAEREHGSSGRRG
jgi:hypothetical protein